MDDSYNNMSLKEIEGLIEELNRVYSGDKMTVNKRRELDKLESARREIKEIKWL